MMRKWHFMACVAVVASATLPVVGGVYDDCIYLFEGGLDANGNGLFSTGELRDELHASNHLILSSPSPPALNLIHHQDLYQQVSSLHQVAKVLELQLQHQSFQ